MKARVGDKFPDFKLENQDGKTRSLADYSGKFLVLYVYPKDDTPGCTIQGQSFTATKSEFEKLGIEVVGLSADGVKSHKDFCTKYSFKVELLSDPSATLLKALGVGQTEYKGTMYWDRTTFVVGRDGLLKKIYEKVNPQGHEQALLRDLSEMVK
jgi:peroxiredoxin Q/BCP